jgi:hypothetical protein
MKRIVAVLETMWGEREGRAPRWFKINPNNHSGRRLYKFVGSENKSRLVVTNACRELVISPTHHGKPDPEWLGENLRRLNPSVILICGNVAKETFDKACPMIWDGDAKVIYMPHPAARTWTKTRLREMEKRIQKACL